MNDLVRPLTPAVPEALVERALDRMHEAAGAMRALASSGGADAATMWRFHAPFDALCAAMRAAGEVALDRLKTPEAKEGD